MGKRACWVVERGAVRVTIDGGLGDYNVRVYWFLGLRCMSCVGTVAAWNRPVRRLIGGSRSGEFFFFFFFGGGSNV